MSTGWERRSESKESGELVGVDITFGPNGKLPHAQW